ncbi:bifunctional DNA primase/polymerase [Goodfellowiella coeruleoviolacea]|uniref:Bifunctional DNA primase/polymerase, N-terminal n=1 Tax=Goodfellowiella coeruleoviolacea TaxID=334858 RepID=A0AAE3KJ29_9PSEU|nr:bifunctional DNA primase/polymerase [Goodfellowiella coeruleoviolacea]MCP2169851.1 Bifunctional DNA primase/polymerase, N-terminal [Goodfellowiella coeruleoviolacea]
MQSQDDTVHGLARRRAHRAALDYAEHGWMVLPGSVWTARGYVAPGALLDTQRLLPAVPLEDATTDAATIARWWGGDDNPLVPSVLIRPGTAFAVLSLAWNIAELVFHNRRFRRRPGPVLYRADEGQAYFLVEPGVSAPAGLGCRPGDVLLLDADGAWIAAPPTRAKNFEVVWWRHPDSVGWRLCDAAITCAAVVAAVRRLATRRRPGVPR